MKYFALLLCSLVVLLSFGCKTRVGLLTPEPVEVYQQRLTLEEIAEAIYDAASSRGWEVTEEGPGYMLMTYLPDAQSKYLSGNSRSANLKYSTIRADYDIVDVEISYLSSENLKYEYITDGKQTVHFRYNRQLNGLVQAIQHELDERTRI